MRATALSFLLLIMSGCMLITNGCVISPRRIVNGPPAGSGGGGGNQEFTMSVNPVSQSVNIGGSATYFIDVEPENDFSGTITLDVQSPVAANISPTSINVPGQASLLVTTSSGTPTGTHSISVTGTSSGGSQSVTVVLTVNDPATAAASLPAACLDANANSGLQMAKLPSQPGAHGFIAEFDVTSSSSLLNGAIGFFSPDGGQLVFHEMFEFSPEGVIRAIDGETQSGSVRFPYQAGETYHFRLVETLPAAAYSLFVTPPGGTETPLALNIQPPPSQRGASTITGLGAITHSPDNAALEVCNFTVQ
jgi:hypothetical protein